jgi:methenyltetrahydromethanopterin cyclohydrolase
VSTRRRGDDPYAQPTVTLSLNDRAHELADRLADDAEVLRVAVTKLPNGTRLIDCGSDVPGGLEAGRRFAQVCMGGLGWVTFTPLVLDGRWMPGLAVVTDHPARACLASQYAGWKLEGEDFFAMASGPGRALIRAEELYDDLDVEERAQKAVLCLETGQAPPEPIADKVAERAGVAADDLTLLFAPTASLAGGVQVAARVVETALHKLHELEFDVRRVVSGIGSCPLPPVSKTDPEAIGRTNDAVLYGGQVQLTVDAPHEELEELAPRLPASASDDHGEPFGRVLERAEWDFYKIDPLLFSPAELLLTSVPDGRSVRAGSVDVGVLEQSFLG